MTRHHRPTATLLLSRIESLTALRFPGPPRDWIFESLRGEDRKSTGWRWRMRRRELAGLEIGSPDSADSVLTAHRVLAMVDSGTVEVKVQKL